MEGSYITGTTIVLILNSNNSSDLWWANGVLTYWDGVGSNQDETHISEG